MEESCGKAGNYEVPSTNMLRISDTNLHNALLNYLNSFPGMGTQVCKEEKGVLVDGTPFLSAAGHTKLAVQRRSAAVGGRSPSGVQSWQKQLEQVEGGKISVCSQWAVSSAQ